MSDWSKSDKFGELEGAKPPIMESGSMVDPNITESDARWAKYSELAKPKIKTKDDIIQERMRKGYSWLPSGQSMAEHISPSLIKGILPISSLVPQTNSLSDFENNNSITSTGLQIAGGTGAMMAPAGAISRTMGAGFIPQFLGQNALNAPSHVIDTLLRKGKETTKEDVGKDLMWASGESVVPAALTRAIGASPRLSSDNYWNYFRTFMDRPRVPPGGTAPHGGTNMRPEDYWSPGNMARIFGRGGPEVGLSASPHPSNIHSPAPMIQQANTGMIPALSEAQVRGIHSLGLGALGVSHSGPIGGLLGLAGGAAISPFVEPLERGAVRAVQHPTTQDIIRALMQQSKKQTEPALEGQ